MIYLALVHLRDLACTACGAPLAEAGARSFVVDADGEPHGFPEEGAPEELRVALTCPLGHENELYVPNEIGAEETMRTPDDAPIGADARII